MISGFAKIVHLAETAKELASSRLCLCFLVLTLVSCARPSDLQYEVDDYIDRLSRTLKADSPAAEPVAVMRVEAPKVDVPPLKISLLDFLQLFGCELQFTIGERNSSLGRVATDSQRLLNTLQMLRQAPACIEALMQGEREEDARQLQQLMSQKQRQLPALIYNAVLAGPEFRELWSPRMPTDYPDNTNSDVIDALQRLVGYVEGWLAGDLAANGAELELTLAELRLGDAGALLQGLAIASAGLERAGSVVESRLARRPVCLSGRPNAMSRTFERVVLGYFIGSVQRRQAVLNRRQYELLASIWRLETLLLEVQPAAYRGWADRRDRALRQYREAPRAHVEQLKKVFQQCGSDFGR